MAAKKTKKSGKKSSKTTSGPKKTGASKKATKKTETTTASATSKTSSGGKKKKKATTLTSPAKTTKKKTTKKKTTKKKTKTAASKDSGASKAAETSANKAEAAPKKAKAPKKPAFDAEFLNTVRDELADERRLLLAMMQSTQNQLAHKETGLADPSDIASGGMEDDLALGLMANEAAMLEKIDGAIRRIDEGTYGICFECEKPIPKKRLEFLPFALRCLECEGNRERRARIGSPSDE